MIISHKPTPNLKKARTQRQRGQALVEFALVSPILLMALMAVMDFGKVILSYVQGVGALREASRYAEVVGYVASDGGEPRYLDCEGMESSARRVLMVQDQAVNIEYVKKDGVTTYTCDTVSADVLENGDMLRINSTARVDLLSPFITPFLPSIQMNFRAQRTIIKNIRLGLDYEIDTDFDGLPDAWEMLHFGDLSHIATENLDGDLCNLGCEASRNLNPFLDDTDAEGLLDHEEAYYYETLGNNPDTDGDILTDFEEVRVVRDFMHTPRDLDPTRPDYDQRLCYSSPLLADTDGDGLNDYAELNTSTTEITNPCDTDTDNDGLNDYEESVFGTSPILEDTDGDGLLDRDEIEIHTTDPLLPDTDGDTISDGDEVNTEHSFVQPGGTFTCKTNPLVRDTDADGIDDATELAMGLNPCDPDWDKDGLLDGIEASYQTDPKDSDTDNDGLSDGFEATTIVDNGTTNFGACMQPGDLDGDTDNDGLNDRFEWEYGDLNVLNPCVYDTDSDGMPDGEQYDPSNGDSDGDGLRDSWEVSYFGSIELYDGNSDPDGDGLTNIQEHPINTGTFNYPGTNPMKYDTDNDGLSDAVEYATLFDADPNNNLNPNNPDTDGDSLFDGFNAQGVGEAGIPAPYQACKTNPLRQDTDGDGIKDADELTVFWSSVVNGQTQNETLVLNPCNPDSDGDGLFDGLNPTSGLGETAYTNSLYPTCKTHPLRVDTDGDGLNDTEELARGTNPCNRDTDGDGLADGVELTLAQQYPAVSPHTFTLSATKADSDNDGLSDFDEHCDQPTGKPECGSGLTAKAWNTSPVNPDSDGDGRTDGKELFEFTDPYKITNPSVVDTDEDGVSDGQELINGTLPNNRILVTLRTPGSAFVEAEKGNDPALVYMLTIELDKASPEPTVITYRTRSGSTTVNGLNPATSGTDYVAIDTGMAQFCQTTGNGSNATTVCNNINPVTIPAGTRTITIPVFIWGDTSRDGNEYFYVDLMTARNAKLQTPSAMITIDDQDS